MRLARPVRRSPPILSRTGPMDRHRQPGSSELAGQSFQGCGEGGEPAVGAGVGVDDVVARVTVSSVGSGASIHGVLAVVAADGILSVAAPNVVITIATIGCIVVQYRSAAEPRLRALGWTGVGILLLFLVLGASLSI